MLLAKAGWRYRFTMTCITSNYQMRGGKELPLKAIVDEGLALGGCECI